MKRLLHGPMIAALIAVGAAAPAFAISPLLKEFEDAYVHLGELVLPSVVEISAEVAVDPEERERMNDLFRQFQQRNEGTPPKEDGEGGEGGGGDNEQPAPTPLPEQRAPDGPPAPAPSATGSGFVFDLDGHIITNNHVVQNSTKLTVKLQDGTEREATVVGQDPDSDIAVIKIDPAGLTLTPVSTGDSDTIKVGQFAIALGSPRGLTGSVSFGHISALGREELEMPDRNLRFQHFIQTDAAINLGNSGGPLCNIDGQVIGVNIAIAFGANSIGFAIPVNMVKKIVPQLIASGRVSRGWLGVQIVNIDEAADAAEQELSDYIEAYKLPDAQGALVRLVTPQGPAEKAGLKPEDVVHKINGVRVASKTDLIKQISDIAPGATVDLEVYREGSLTNIQVLLGEFKDRETATFGPAVLGMFLDDLSPRAAEQIAHPDLAGRAFVPAIAKDSPAAAAKIAPNDIIMKIAHKDAPNLESVKALIKENARPGKTLLVRVMQPGGEEESKFIKVPDGWTAE